MRRGRAVTALEPWNRYHPAVPIVLASLMVLIMLLPAEVWDHPEVDVVLHGFDPVTMYSDPQGKGTLPGLLDMREDTLTLGAVPGARPLVHLVTAPLSFRSQFDLTIHKADFGTVPLVVAVWSPYANLRFQLLFESLPGRRVLLQQVRRGVVVAEEELGVYTVDQPYVVSAEVDRIAQSVRLEVASREGDVFSGVAAVAEGHGQEYDTHVITQTVPVRGGDTYTLSANLRTLLDGPSGMSIEWIDAQGRRIEQKSQWDYRQAGSGWVGVAFEAVAPPDAVRASVEIASSQSSRFLFADVRLSSQHEPQRNLLPNGDFSQGGSGWRRSEGRQPLEFRDFAVRSFEGSIDAEAWPELFGSTRMALTLEASSIHGLSLAGLSEHVIEMSHQRWLAVKVDDWRPRLLSAVLGLAGLLYLYRSLEPRLRRMAQERRLPRLPRWPFSRRHSWWLAAVLAGFLVGNALLSRVGSSNADLVGANVWAHLSALHGLEGLYFQANVTSAEAIQWSGLPLQEAGFPYGPLMSYATWAQSTFFMLFFDGFGELEIAGLLVHLAKLTNAIFAAAGAVVIYLILQPRMGRRWAVAGALLYLLNPAVWFAGSVWGSSQAVSLLVLLLAVLFATRDRLDWAWTFLFAAAATRPQYLIPIAVMAAYLLGRAGFRVQIMAIARAVIVVFLMLLPASLAISPTLAVDNLYNAFFMHLADGNDAWTKPLSWGGQSLWPLIVNQIYEVRGVDRVLFPATTEFMLGLSFFQVGSAITMAAIGALSLVAFLVARLRRSAAAVPLLIATASLTLFTFKTGSPTYHYILPLGMLIAARGALPRRTYLMAVGLLSLTTFTSMYAMGAYWLTRHPNWAVGIYDPDHLITRFFGNLALADGFITAGGVSNLVLVFILVVHLVRPFPETAGRPLRWPWRAADDGVRLREALSSQAALFSDPPSGP